MIDKSAVRLVPDCRVSIAGKKLDTGKDAVLTRVGVDLDVNLFGQCVLVFNDPQMALINGRDFECGTRVEVELGFHTSLKKIFDGEIVALEPMFRRDMPPALRVVCLEVLHRLALSQMTRALNDVDDKQIATLIAQEHGLTADAPAGTKEHVFQGNLTDAGFLRRIAARRGNTLRIEGKKLTIGPPRTGQEVQIHPGDGVTRIKILINAKSQVGEVSVHGWDPKAKREITASAKPQGQAQKGAKDHGGSATLSISGTEAPMDTATAEAIARGRLRKLAEGFIRAEAEMIGNPDVVPGAVLRLDKLGAQIDGPYRVERAVHAFDKHGYRVKFRAVRIAEKKPAAKPAPAAAGAREQAEKFDIEIKLVDAQDQPQMDMGYELTLPDGKKVSSFTDADGLIRATSARKGNARLELFPDRKRPSPPQPLPGGAFLIELQIVTGAGDPVPDRAWELTLPDGAVRTGRSDEQGFVRARTKVAGEARLRLPEIDPSPKPVPKPTPAPQKQRFRLRLCDEAWNPLAKAPCTVFLDAGGASMQTGDDGFIEIGDDQPHEQARIEWSSPSGAKFVRRLFLDLGKGEEPSRRRLHNLGYAGDDSMDSKVRRFQDDFGRQSTGRIEDIENDLRRWHDGGAKPSVGDALGIKSAATPSTEAGKPARESDPGAPPVPQLTAGTEDAPLIPRDLSLEGGKCTLSVVELVGAGKDSGRRSEPRARFTFRIDEPAPFTGKRTTLLRFLLAGDDEGIREQHDDDELARTGAHVWVQDGFKGDVFDTRRLHPGTAFSVSVFAHSQFGGRMGRAPALTLRGRQLTDWVEVRADRVSRVIDVEVAVHTSELDGSLGSAFQFVRQMILRGIGRFWSRTVQLTDGSSWKVNVRATEQTVGVEFQCMKSLWQGQRACNTGVVVAGMPVIFPFNPDRPELDAMETAAHEFGHSVLRATMGSDFSMRHKGTSTDWQNPRDDATDTPATGEIDLMKYFKAYHPDYLSRTIAAQEDVLRLVSLGAVVLER